MPADLSPPARPLTSALFRSLARAIQPPSQPASSPARPSVQSARRPLAGRPSLQSARHTPLGWQPLKPLKLPLPPLAAPPQPLLSPPLPSERLPRSCWQDRTGKTAGSRARACRSPETTACTPPFGLTLEMGRLLVTTFPHLSLSLSHFIQLSLSLSLALSVSTLPRATSVCLYLAKVTAKERADSAR